MNYQGASAKCEALGGNLPTIQSLEDFDYVNSMTSDLSWTALHPQFKNNKVLKCKGMQN